MIYNHFFLITHDGSDYQTLTRMIIENKKYYLADGISLTAISNLKNYDEELFDKTCNVKNILHINTQNCFPINNHIMLNFKFIFYISDPNTLLNTLRKKYSEEKCVRYYSFRLRRMWEMFNKTKNKIFLRKEDVYNNVKKINDIFNIKNTTNMFIERKYNKKIIHESFYEQCCQKYNHYSLLFSNSFSKSNIIISSN